MIYDPNFLSRFIAPKGTRKQRRLERLAHIADRERPDRKKVDEAIAAFRVRTGNDKDAA